MLHLHTSGCFVQALTERVSYEPVGTEEQDDDDDDDELDTILKNSKSIAPPAPPPRLPST